VYPKVLEELLEAPNSMILATEVVPMVRGLVVPPVSKISVSVVEGVPLVFQFPAVAQVLSPAPSVQVRVVAEEGVLAARSRRSATKVILNERFRRPGEFIKMGSLRQ
jgi:hypothetical protein